MGFGLPWSGLGDATPIANAPRRAGFDDGADAAREAGDSFDEDQRGKRADAVDRALKAWQTGDIDAFHEATFDFHQAQRADEERRARATENPAQPAANLRSGSESPLAAPPDQPALAEPSVRLGMMPEWERKNPRPGRLPEGGGGGGGGGEGGASGDRPLSPAPTSPATEPSQRPQPPSEQEQRQQGFGIGGTKGGEPAAPRTGTDTAPSQPLLRPLPADRGFDPANLRDKLHAYLLDPEHPQNRGKAVWFQKALGFDKNNWEDLASQLYFDEWTAVLEKNTPDGQFYKQDVRVTGPNGRTIDVTFIFMKEKSGRVKFITGVPTRK